MKTKKFEPWQEDYEFVIEQLLKENLEVDKGRIGMLKYIFKKYPEIFWEAYGNYQSN